MVDQLPAQVLIAVFTFLNLIMILFELRYKRLTFGVGLPVFLWTLSTFLFYLVQIYDCFNPPIASSSDYKLWSLTMRLQGAIAFYGLLSQRRSLLKAVRDEVQRLLSGS